MRYTVFISHSSEDISVVRFIASQLHLCGITPVIAQDTRPEQFPQQLSDKVRRLIQGSDCVAVLLTRSGVASNWVHQERGYSLDKKPVIPIVESGVSSEELAFLEGVEYIPLYWEDITRSASRLVSWTAQLKAEKAQTENLRLLAMFILGGLGLWWWSQKK